MKRAKPHFSREQVQELSAAIGKSERYVYYLLSEDRRGKKPHPSTAKALEEKTGWSRLWWLYPDEYDQSGRPLNRRTSSRRCSDRGGEDGPKRPERS